MIPKNRIPTHPGEVLRYEFLEPLGLSQVDFARHLGIPLQRLNEVVLGRRGVSPDTAWLLAGALGTSPEFWMNLQSNFDLARAKPANLIVTTVKFSALGDSLGGRKLIHERIKERHRKNRTAVHAVRGPKGGKYHLKSAKGKSKG